MPARIHKSRISSPVVLHRRMLPEGSRIGEDIVAEDRSAPVVGSPVLVHAVLVPIQRVVVDLFISAGEIQPHA